MVGRLWSFKELIEAGKNILESAASKGSMDSLTPSLDSQWLAEFLVFQNDKFKERWNTRLSDRDVWISNRIAGKFFAKIRKRAEGVPLAYLIQEKYFLSYRFLVQKGVLIPRPETELLVEAAVDKMLKRSEEGSFSRVLDLGTGTGCIGLGFRLFFNEQLKKYQSQRKAGLKSPTSNDETPFQLVLVDRSKKALAVAKQNAKSLKVTNTRFVHSKVEDLKIPKASVDLILANPPYIGRTEWVQPSVLKHEPHRALFSANEGYSATANWLKHGIGWLKPGGTLGMEINPMHQQQIRQDLENLGYEAIEFIEDYSGFVRHVFAQSKADTEIQDKIKTKLDKTRSKKPDQRSK